MQCGGNGLNRDVHRPHRFLEHYRGAQQAQQAQQAPHSHAAHSAPSAPEMASSQEEMLSKA